jgi:hypothetical protein
MTVRAGRLEAMTHRPHRRAMVKAAMSVTTILRPLATTHVWPPARRGEVMLGHPTERAISITPLWQACVTLVTTRSAMCYRAGATLILLRWAAEISVAVAMSVTAGLRAAALRAVTVFAVAVLAVAIAAISIRAMICLRATRLLMAVSFVSIARALIVMHGLIGLHGRALAFTTALTIGAALHLGALLLVGAAFTMRLRRTISIGATLLRAACLIRARAFGTRLVGLPAFTRRLALAGLLAWWTGWAVGFAILLGEGGETDGGQQAAEDHQGVESGFHGMCLVVG